MCSVYSSYAFDAHLQDMDPSAPTIDAYLLPHLPLNDAAALQYMLADGDARFRVCNDPLLSSKIAAYAEILRVRDKLKHLESPVEIALGELVTQRGQLALILGADEDKDFAVPRDNAEAEALLSRWGAGLEEKRAMATASRRRVLLAVHLAVLLEADEAAVAEDVHHTMLRLAPELHDRIFGNPKHSDPCTDLPNHDDAEWYRRDTRTSVALQQLMREIGVQMEPRNFLKFSLEQARRELVEHEGDLTRREFCLLVLRTIQDAIVTLSSMTTKLHQEIQEHLKHPTLLGCKVSSDVMPYTQPPFFKGLDDLSEEELCKAVRSNLSTSY